MRGGAVAALLVAAALLLSGCQYLLGPLGGGPVFVPGPGDFGSFDPGDFGSFDPNDPAFALRSPEATYTKGSAEVTIDGETWHLDRLAGTGRMYKEFGTDVGWTDGNGNYLHLFGSGGPGGLGFVSIDRIVDGKHLNADLSACTPKIDKSDATGISGSAVCKGGRWIDMLNGAAGFMPQSPGPSFDAEIAFEATP
jgi:hypothetical protein